MFFVDEIHRLPRALEETFYPAMEDAALPITVGQGAGARVVTLPLPPFTLIGATTRTGLLTTPLRDRFGIQHRLEHYGSDDLATIVRRSARLLGVEISDDGAVAIADRSRGTPRVANRLLKRVRDYAEVRHSGVVSEEIAAEALDLLEVDHEGLDRLDREILRAICERFGGGPVGLSTLAVAVGEESDTIEDVYEPYLLQRGLIERTPRGRAATRARLQPSWTRDARATDAAVDGGARRSKGRSRAPIASEEVSKVSPPSVYPQNAMSPRALLHLPPLWQSIDGNRSQRRLQTRGSRL